MILFNKTLLVLFIVFQEACPCSRSVRKAMWVTQVILCWGQKEIAGTWDPQVRSDRMG